MHAWINIATAPRDDKLALLAVVKKVKHETIRINSIFSMYM